MILQTVFSEPCKERWVACILTTTLRIGDTVSLELVPAIQVQVTSKQTMPIRLKDLATTWIWFRVCLGLIEGGVLLYVVNVNHQHFYDYNGSHVCVQFVDTCSDDEGVLSCI